MYIPLEMLYPFIIGMLYIPKFDKLGE